MFNEADPSIEKTLITTKLGKLTQYQRLLRILQANTLEDFTSDFKTSGAPERYLQVAIECIIDIGNEIISSLQLQRPERYGDIPYILAEAKIIPKTFTETIASLIGFRNLLVHDYASINPNLVYEFLQTKLPDFENFSKHIAKWLEKA